MTLLTILEFIGGCWDGMNLCDGSPDPVETTLARRIYRITADGRQGEKAVMPSRHALGKPGVCGHVYTVTNRTATRGETLVRLECVAEHEADHCLFQEDAAPPMKRISLEFEGGYFDGIRLDNQSSDAGEALLATAYYCVTDEGTVGKGFGETPPPWRSKAKMAGFSKDHEYQIVHRAEGFEEVTLKCKYSPKRSSQQDPDRTSSRTRKHFDPRRD